MGAELDAALAQLSALARRGREIRHDLLSDAAHQRPQAAARIWQHDCAALVSQLSGGSKAHWLSRAYSAALLVRSGDGGAIVEAPVAEIVSRVLDVLDRAAQSLLQPEAELHGAMAGAMAGEMPHPRRFDFVRDASIRPVIEAAYVESGRALAAGDYTQSLLTSCSVIEALLTDALSPSVPSESSFADRIAAAEKRRLIRGGCARLPAVAHDYRRLGESAIVTERDARVTRQVMHVVLRDLDPGR